MKRFMQYLLVLIFLISEVGLTQTEKTVLCSCGTHYITVKCPQKSIEKSQKPKKKKIEKKEIKPQPEKKEVITPQPPSSAKIVEEKPIPIILNPRIQVILSTDSLEKAFEPFLKGIEKERKKKRDLEKQITTQQNRLSAKLEASGIYVAQPGIDIGQGQITLEYSISPPTQSNAFRAFGKLRGERQLLGPPGKWWGELYGGFYYEVFKNIKMKFGGGKETNGTEESWRFGSELEIGKFFDFVYEKGKWDEYYKVQCHTLHPYFQIGLIWEKIRWNSYASGLLFRIPIRGTPFVIEGAPMWNWQNRMGKSERKLAGKVSIEATL